jgi:cyclohexyl-isocyanide hydratase
MAALKVGFLLFPNLTQLDLTGPLQVLHRLPNAKVEIVAKTLDPVASDCGLKLLPTTDFANCGALDLLCVPGGAVGVAGAIADQETIDFVRGQGARVRWLTSVCTGAFILGAAGLLRGKRATTHWAYTGLLPLVGATHEKARVVRDGNLFTGGGVTAGIDFGLTVVAEIASPELAQAIQLGIEYDPSPPFDAGDPERAPPTVRTGLIASYEKRVAQIRTELERVKIA